MWIFESFL